MVLFIDNGWTAAPDWEARRSLAEEAVRLAARSAAARVIVLTTAERPDTEHAGQPATPNAPRARWRRSLGSPAVRAALAALTKTKFAARPEILWLSDGVDDGNAAEAAKHLSHLGQLRIFADAKPGRWR